jgi:hypothetical protein
MTLDKLLRPILVQCTSKQNHQKTNCGHRCEITLDAVDVCSLISRAAGRFDRVPSYSELFAFTHTIPPPSHNIPLPPSASRLTTLIPLGEVHPEIVRSMVKILNGRWITVTLALFFSRHHTLNMKCFDVHTPPEFKMYKQLLDPVHHPMDGLAPRIMGRPAVRLIQGVTEMMCHVHGGRFPFEIVLLFIEYAYGLSKPSKYLSVEYSGRLKHRA